MTQLCNHNMAKEEELQLSLFRGWSCEQGCSGTQSLEYYNVFDGTWRYLENGEVLEYAVHHVVLGQIAQFV